jgi:hypothetical protein
METDLAEEMDLSGEHPERVEEMRLRWDVWYEDVMADWRRASSDNRLI